MAAAIQGPTSHPRTPGEDAEAWLRPAMLIAAFGLTAATLWALFSPLRTLKVQPDPTPCW